MNVFENVEFLCGVVKGSNDLINRFFSVAVDVKNALGEKSKLLDEYLLAIFEAVNSIDILSATNMADNLCANVLHSCRCVLKNQPITEQRHFYKETKQYIESHNFDSINFETKVYFYVANVLIDNIENMSKIFACETKNKILSISKYEKINRKYQEIIGLIDERKIELLNSLLDEAFIICPINTIFVQALMLKIVEFMLYQDADCFYSFVHGFWNLDKIEYPEKYLESVVPDEYNKDGVLKKHFDIIYNLEDKLQDIEEQARKDEDGFNIYESMVTEIRNEYHDLIDDFSKKMFMYGMKFGIKLAKKII